MSRRLILGCLIGLIATDAFARPVSVRGYFRKDGTYVQPHIRSSPNNTTLDNYNQRSSPPVYPFVSYPTTITNDPKPPPPPMRLVPATPAQTPQAPTDYEIEALPTFLTVCDGNYRRGADLLAAGVCTGFVGGIINRDKLAGTDRQICMPEWVDAIDVIPSITSYVRQYGSPVAGSTVHGVVKALAETYPCHSGR